MGAQMRDPSTAASAGSIWYASDDAFMNAIWSPSRTARPSPRVMSSPVFNGLSDGTLRCVSRTQAGTVGRKKLLLTQTEGPLASVHTWYHADPVGLFQHCPVGQTFPAVGASTPTRGE